MLYRSVRPMRREGTRNIHFQQRIPADIQPGAVGMTLNVPLGQSSARVTITAKTQTLRFSLRTGDPAEVKIRAATAAAYLETVWHALRRPDAVSLTYRQATALAGDLYRAWAGGEDTEKTLAVEWDGQRMVPASVSQEDEPLSFKAGTALLEKIAESERPEDLEAPLGPIIDRLLLSKGIARVDNQSRPLLLEAFRLALVDAFDARRRNARGDFTPDTKAARFPKWVAPNAASAKASRVQSGASSSLKGLVEDWWRESKAAGMKPSTYDSYRASITSLAAFLKHDDAARVTHDDINAFKQYRLTTVNPRTGKAVSPKTVKDSDLSGLKSVFRWAVSNGRMAENPAKDVTIKLGKTTKLRSKGFTDTEARAILMAASGHQQGREQTQTWAAKRWVPWLCAYTGARVGELAQLRKQDLRQEVEHWIIRITPEAGTVKTNEARDVVLHEHLVGMGFCDFVKAAAPGHLFLRPGKDGDVRGPWRSIKNRLRDFARQSVTDPNVSPNHGWRHRFKTVGREAGIDAFILDTIQGQAPRSVADSYGDVTVKTMAAAMVRIPRIVIDGEETKSESAQQ